jgi:hypothetical protein
VAAGILILQLYQKADSLRNVLEAAVPKLIAAGCNALNQLHENKGI